MMSMLKAIHSLIKFAKLKDVFVYDFIAIVMIHEGMFVACSMTSNLLLKVMCSIISLS
jgi:hypothetical protein